MERYNRPLHIVSAHLEELGITIGRQTVEGKRNEIPAVRELLGLLDVEGCMIVADALNCQKETAKAIRMGKADLPIRLPREPQIIEIYSESKANAINREIPGRY